MKKLTEYYDEYLAIKKELQKAVEEHSFDEVKRCHNERDNLFNEVRSHGVAYSYAFHYLFESRKCKNACVNIEEIPEDLDVVELVDVFRTSNLIRFTVSSQQADIVKILWKFTECGCNLIGMIEVKYDYDPTYVNEETGEVEGRHMTTPAFVFDIN